MKGIRRIWTVESGCYSDHSVLGVFEDEATANAWRDAIANDEDGWHHDAYVGTIDLVAAGTKPKKTTVWNYNVTLWDNGETETRGPSSRSDYPIGSLSGEPPARPKVRYVRAPIHKNKGGFLEVVGKSEAEVLKVGSERIAMWKAGAWAGPKHKEIVE